MPPELTCLIETIEKTLAPAAAVCIVSASFIAGHARHFEI